MLQHSTDEQHYLKNVEKHFNVYSEGPELTRPQQLVQQQPQNFNLNNSFVEQSTEHHVHQQQQQPQGQEQDAGNFTMYVERENGDAYGGTMRFVRLAENEVSIDGGTEPDLIEHLHQHQLPTTATTTGQHWLFKLKLTRRGELICIALSTLVTITAIITLISRTVSSSRPSLDSDTADPSVDITSPASIIPFELTSVLTTIRPTVTPNRHPTTRSTLASKYAGFVSMTSSGKVCQAWTSQQPHKHNNFQNSQFPRGNVSAAKNYCRDPDLSGFLWCYTTDRLQRWENCTANLQGLQVNLCANVTCLQPGTSCQQADNIRYTCSSYGP